MKRFFIGTSLVIATVAVWSLVFMDIPDATAKSKLTPPVAPHGLLVASTEDDWKAGDRLVKQGELIKHRADVGQCMEQIEDILGRETTEYDFIKIEMYSERESHHGAVELTPKDKEFDAVKRALSAVPEAYKQAKSHGE